MQYRKMMSSSDAIIWNIEKDPQLRSTVMAVWQLDETPSPERMAANVDRMIAAIPRLRQTVAPGKPRPIWNTIDASELDLAHHFVTEEMPAGSTMDDVLNFAQGWVRDPFDRTRPLWRFGLLTGLADGKAAIVIKVHHAIADGMGMVLLLGAFTDFERNPPARAAEPEAPTPSSTREVYSPAKRARVKATRAMATFAKNPAEALRSAGRTAASTVRLVTPHRTPHSTLMTRRSERFVMATRSVPLATFKAHARARDLTVNDLFVAVMSEALIAHHARLGHACEKARLHMPVDARSGRTIDLVGNQWVPARVSLDLQADSPDQRKTSIAQQLEVLRNEPSLGHINPVSAGIQRLGKPISRWIVGGMMKGVDVLFSNVPGPSFPLYCAGAKIEHFTPFGPPGGAALNATLFSYDEVVTIGLTIDDVAVVDTRTFLQSLDDVLTAWFDTSATLTEADIPNAVSAVASQPTLHSHCCEPPVSPEARIRFTKI